MPDYIHPYDIALDNICHFQHKKINNLGFIEKQRKTEINEYDVVSADDDYEYKFVNVTKTAMKNQIMEQIFNNISVCIASCNYSLKYVENNQYNFRNESSVTVSYGKEARSIEFKQLLLLIQELKELQ